MHNKSGFFKKNVLPVLVALNVIALCIISLGILTNLDDIPILRVNYFVYVIILGLSPIIAIIIVSIISGKHEFYEWDKKEREKKRAFLANLVTIVFFFTYLSVFLLSTVIFDLTYLDFDSLDHPERIVLFIKILSGIISLLNAIFPVQLHSKVYSSYLTLDEYRLAKKPDNWEWERTYEDDINDRIAGR